MVKQVHPTEPGLDQEVLLLKQMPYLVISSVVLFHLLNYLLGGAQYSIDLFKFYAHVLVLLEKMIRLRGGPKTTTRIDVPISEASGHNFILLNIKF